MNKYSVNVFNQDRENGIAYVEEAEEKDILFKVVGGCSNMYFQKETRYSQLSHRFREN